MSVGGVEVSRIEKQGSRIKSRKVDKEEGGKCRNEAGNEIRRKEEDF